MSWRFFQAYRLYEIGPLVTVELGKQSKSVRPSPHLKVVCLASFLKGQGHQGIFHKLIFSLVKGTLWENCKFLPVAFQGHQGNDQGTWRQSHLLPLWSILPWPNFIELLKHKIFLLKAKKSLLGKIRLLTKPRLHPIVMLSKQQPNTSHKQCIWHDIFASNMWKINKLFSCLSKFDA